MSGTRLERNRPTRQTAWPGEPAADAVEDVVIDNRDENFVQFVVADVARRHEAEAAFNTRVDSGWNQDSAPKGILRSVAISRTQSRCAKTGVWSTVLRPSSVADAWGSSRVLTWQHMT